MAIKSQAGIYQVLEALLRQTDKPLTCVDLFDNKDVKKHAADPNKVSDYLGHMWRRGLLQRWFNPKDSTQKARYAYTWKETATTDPTPVPVPLRVVRGNEGYIKPNVTITEDEGCVTLDFEQFTITVQRKA